MNEFQEKLKAFSKKIDMDVIVPTEEDKKPKVIQYYNIHKRSLSPIGMNTVVMYGLTLEEAEIIEKIYPAKVKNDGSVIFYEKVKADCRLEEKSIFYNERPFVFEVL